MGCKIAVIVLVFAVSALRAQTDVLTAQYNLNRTSSNMQETILNRANVNNQQFGRLFSRSVDAPFYASPLVVTNLNIPGVGTRNVVYIATRGNTVYAFDADDPNASSAYWSVNFGTSLPRICCILGPSVGILSTPVIDRSTNTIYVVAIVQSMDSGMYVYALDLATGAFKFHSPRRITFTFRSGVVKTSASTIDGASWVQRAGLLLSNNILYVGTSNVWEGNTIDTQQGMIQAFRADDLSAQLGTFETAPDGGGGGFWQAGRGIAADASGNLFVAINSGVYSPPDSFGSSVLKLSPESLAVTDWFTPANWNFLYTQNVDVSAGGVTLIPGTSLAFTGGKAGVIYLLNQGQLGGLEPGSGNTPLQQFQASHGCGTAPCGQHLPTAFWPNANPLLYVWDVYDVLRAIPFDPASQRFVTTAATAGTFTPTRIGGMTISSNGTAPQTGIVWAATAAQDPYSTAVPGTLRAFNADDITQELYNSDQDSCRDSMGLFVKMSTPIVANGKVYVNSQSNFLPVYGLLSSVAPGGPPAGTIHVTVNASTAGPTIAVDGNTPCAGTAEFDWIPGTSHTLSAPSPQIGIIGTRSPLTGTQYVWKSWSDGGAVSHAVSPANATSYTANFTTQYLLTTGATPEAAGGISLNPPGAVGYFDAGTAVQLTASPNPGCTFLNWSGAVTGTVNPQTVVMSAPQNVTANFQCSVPPPASFVTGTDLKILRNDFSGWVGMEFTVGQSAINVSALGRILVYGNSTTHTIKLVKAADGSDVPGGSVSVSMIGGTVGLFKYASLASPVTLAPNTTYYLVSQETDSGDWWYDSRAVTVTSDGVANHSIYSSDGITWSILGTSTSYVPVSFRYTTGGPAQYSLTPNISPSGGGSITANPSSPGGSYAAGTPVQLTATPASGCSFVNWTGALTGSTNPQTVTMSGPQTVMANFQCGSPSGASFVTGYALNNPPLRRDFGGWVGMKLIVGANPLSISSLGRICVAGNTAPHIVKLVSASDGSDVPGAAVTVNMAGCAAGQFVFGAVSTPTLAAGGSYYLVSQETYGGDQWFDQGAITISNVASVSSAVYFYGGNWITIGAPNTSYVPANFLYSVVVAAPISVTVQTNPAGSSFAVDGSTYTAGQTLTWTSGSSHTIAVSSPQSTGVGTQNVWTSWSDGGAISHPVAPASGITYTANFTTQYLLTSNVAPAGGGSIAASPSSAGGYYDSGTPVQLTATPASSCTFVNWTGTTAGATNSLTVSMSAAQTVTANFQCTGPPAASFLTGYALSGPTLRNDFTGWVGMKLTVGANPLNVTSLGRICVVNNTMTHTVKLVNASTGNDLPGASATVNMAACTPGQFVYGAIALTLPAGTTYYLVSQEIQGGDRWYDQGSVSATNAAAVNSAVYSYNGNWYPIGSANTSYVPPNFQYSVVVPAPISVTVQTNPAGSTFAVDGNVSTASQTLTWTSGASHTITASSPQNAGVGTQNVWTSWSDGGAISHAVAPVSGITYTAKFTTQYLSTSNVSPAGGGSIVANPSSAEGYYDSGTPVQLTATPASGCTFTNWTGTSTGIENTLPVSMSAAQMVTANFQCSGPTSTNFLTGYALSGQTLRNDFTGWVGMKLTVGSNPLTVSSLGRICVANNAMTHTVKFVIPSTGTDLPRASVTVNMAGCTPGQFVFGPIALTLQAGTTYYLVTQETQGGDRWYDQGAVSSTTAAAVNSSVYSYNGNWYPINSSNTSYVPPNFQYSVSGP